MQKFLFLFIFSGLFYTHNVKAQGFIYGVKGGLTAAFQKWQNQQKDVLFTYHGDVFIESNPVDGQFSIFLQAGYHNRGSAIRVPAFSTVSRDFPRLTTKYLFKNLVLAAGGKQRFDFGERSSLYYSLGMRLEYTIGTNLDEFVARNQFYNSLFHPDDGFVRKINYGFLLGGGIETPIAEYVNGFIELNISPDFSNQYLQGPFTGFDPITRNNREFGERAIKNISIELTVGFGFLRKVEYIDDDMY